MLRCWSSTNKEFLETPNIEHVHTLHYNSPPLEISSHHWIQKPVTTTSNLGYGKECAPSSNFPSRCEPQAIQSRRGKLSGYIVLFKLQCRNNIMQQLAVVFVAPLYNFWINRSKYYKSIRSNSAHSSLSFVGLVGLMRCFPNCPIVSVESGNANHDLPGSKIPRLHLKLTAYT